MDRLFDKVKEVLRILPHTRNNDAALVVAIWSLFYANKSCVGDGVTAFTVDAITELGGKIAKFESIRRARQVIQNDEGLYLPTTWKVAKGRRINEDKWKRAMGTTPRDTTVLDAPMESVTPNI